MARGTQLELFPALRPVTTSDTTRESQATSTGGAEPELSEEWSGELIDWDAPDYYDDFGDWKQDYANSVGMRLID